MFMGVDAGIIRALIFRLDFRPGFGPDVIGAGHERNN